MRDLDARIRALPAEVRVKIFAECVAPEFPPFRTPDLLVALRADARLYEEVLEAYYNTNQVEIKRHNRGIFMDLQTRRMAQIKRLAITFDKETVPASIMLSLRVQLKAHRATNLKYLRLNAESNDVEVLRAATVTAGKFPSLKKLVFFVNSSPDYNGALLPINPTEARHLRILSHIRLIEEALGGDLKEQLMHGFERVFIWEK